MGEDGVVPFRAWKGENPGRNGLVEEKNET